MKFSVPRRFVQLNSFHKALIELGACEEGMDDYYRLSKRTKTVPALVKKMKRDPTQLENRRWLARSGFIQFAESLDWSQEETFQQAALSAKYPSYLKFMCPEQWSLYDWLFYSIKSNKPWCSLVLEHCTKGSRMDFARVLSFVGSTERFNYTERKQWLLQKILFQLKGEVKGWGLELLKAWRLRV